MPSPFFTVFYSLFPNIAKSVINPTFGIQLIMISALNNLTLIHDQD